MLLAEPPQTAWDLKFSLAGVPVRVHPLFWLVSALFGINGTGGDFTPLVIWIGAVFVSIVVHEMGHALVIRHFGWQPRITLHGMGGLASYNASHRDPQKHIWISLAGPFAGFLFAALIALAIRLAGHEVQLVRSIGPVLFERFDSERLNELIGNLLFINIFWGLVNLLPVYPLDGGQISYEVLNINRPNDALRLSLQMSIAVAIGVAVGAFFGWRDTYLAFFFGYLAYTNYQMLAAYFGAGGRGW